MTPSEIKGRAFIFDLENNDPNSKNLNGLSDLSRSLASQRPIKRSDEGTSPLGALFNEVSQLISRE